MILERLVLLSLRGWAFDDHVLPFESAMTTHHLRSKISSKTSTRTLASPLEQAVRRARGIAPAPSAVHVCLRLSGWCWSDSSLSRELIKDLTQLLQKRALSTRSPRPKLDNAHTRHGAEFTHGTMQA